MPHLTIHGRNIVVMPGKVVAHCLGVRVIGRQLHIPSLHNFGYRALRLPPARQLHNEVNRALRPIAQWTKYAALVRYRKIDQTEKRLSLRAPGPIAGLRPLPVPDRSRTAAGQRTAELVIQFGVGIGVVSRATQQLRVSFDLRRRHRKITACRTATAAHMLRAGGYLVHAQNMRGPTRRTDTGCSKGAGITHPLRRQSIQIRGMGNPVAECTNPGTHVFCHQQQDIGMLLSLHRHDRRQRQHDPRQTLVKPEISAAHAFAM